MRSAFIKTLVELAAQDERIMLLTADLGYMALEPFRDNFPTRFFNAGVAEQNMVGIATGLAEAGFIPFTYSITPFSVLRPFEFIRNGPILHQLPVRIVGVGGGVEYGHNGYSHYGLEDVGVMRTQPGMTILAPADALQTHTVLKATWDLPGPIYYRIGKDDRTIVPGLDGRFRLGQIELIRTGEDLLFVTMGAIASQVVAAAQELEQENISVAVAVAATLNPPPTQALTELLAQYPLVITAEAHYLNGGIGSLVCECVAEQQLNCRVVRRGVQTVPDGISGSQSFLYEQFGLTPSALAAAARTELERAPRVPSDSPTRALASA